MQVNQWHLKLKSLDSLHYVTSEMWHEMIWKYWIIMQKEDCEHANASMLPLPHSQILFFVQVVVQKVHIIYSICGSLSPSLPVIRKAFWVPLNSKWNLSFEGYKARDLSPTPPSQQVLEQPTTIINQHYNSDTIDNCRTDRTDWSIDLYIVSQNVYIGYFYVTLVLSKETSAPHWKHYKMSREVFFKLHIKTQE